MSFMPIRVTKLELSHPFFTIPAFHSDTGIHYGSVQILVRLHQHPLGLVELPFQGDELTPDDYLPAIWEQLHGAINAHLRQDGLPEVSSIPREGLQTQTEPRCMQTEKQLLENPPFISVVICTHERAAVLEICLDSVLKLQYPNFEVILVDNAPRSTATKDLFERRYSHHPNWHYVLEPNQGQCWARNAGAKAARGEIIANTDDDVIVDPYWLIGVVRGFAMAEKVGCVNGLVIPAELETQEQTWFEQSGGFNKGYEPRIYDMDEHKPDRPFYPFSAGLFGTGANMSIKKSALEDVGYFDPALGAGTITTCGDDLAIYLQLLLGGYKLVYEPSAFLQHIHRREYAALEKQIYNYGVGFSAFLTKTLLDHPLRIPGFVARIPYGLYLLLSPKSFKNTKKQTDYPEGLMGLERRGLIFGVYAYLVSKWRTRKLIKARENR